jgi:GH24 family phage-related lysozyme (muramidase)
MKMGKIGYVAIGAGILAALSTLFNKNKTMEAFKGTEEQVFKFIAKLESFFPKAYWDYAQWSVGYGSGFNWDTNTKVTKDTVVDQATAKRWLLAEANKNMVTINKYVKVPLNANQRTALAAFAYNVGDGGFIGSSLLKKINANAPRAEIEAAWKMWRLAGGVVNQGLINRRAAEIKLFFS